VFFRFLTGRQALGILTLFTDIMTDSIVFSASNTTAFWNTDVNFSSLTPPVPVALNAFNLQTPNNNGVLTTSAASTIPVTLSWDTSATGATYKWVLQTPDTTGPRRLTLSATTNSIMTTLGTLDTYLDLIGVGQGDSLIGKWSVWAFNGIDSLRSRQSRTITLKRQGAANTYVFSKSTTTYTPITSSTQLLGTGVDEGLSSATDIGFSFTYCGTAYTQFQASSNGFIYLGSGFTDPSYGNDLASATVKPVIAPLWDDLATGNTNGKVHYALTGTAPNRKLTIEFKAMKWDLSGNENANFQIIIYETTNMIDFIYGTFGTVSNSSGGASIGINDATGGAGHFVSVTPASTPTTSSTTANNAIGSAAYLTNGVVYRFTPTLINDMQAYSFVSPSANVAIQPNVSFQPKATFCNTGLSTQSNVPVRFEILNSGGTVVYSSTKIISAIIGSLATLDTTTVTFDNCNLTAQATYTMRATALLSTDGNRTNDTLTAYLFSNWVAMGALNTGRAYHTATLLGNGKVLVAGGNGGGYLTSSELCDPSLGTWTNTGTLNTARQYHSATLLGNGKVLVTGGYGNGSSLTSSELYDPSLGTWKTTGALNAARDYHTATMLGNGNVLVVGGYNSSNGILTSSELYDPSLGTWANTGALNNARQYHTATLLSNGKVLVAGGYKNGYLTSSELYDPSLGTWTNLGAPGALNAARDYHTATLLTNGKVLVVGGYNGSSPLTSSELYDPSLGTWTNTMGALNTARYLHTATLLSNGKVLVVGGYNNSSPLTSSELYDPSLGTWTNTGGLITGRAYHTATLLTNGKVLVACGNNYYGSIASSELYDEQIGTALPVELTSFTGKSVSGNVVLSWTTATEKNNAGFDVERSTDNTAFSKIGFVKGNGTTTQSHAYAFTDSKTSGKVFYRLKQTDYDGKFEYSKTVEVQAGTPKAFALMQNYPNPFNPSTVISYQLPVSSQIILKVYDVLGREVKTLVNEHKVAGSYTANFDASKYASGVYFYRLQAGSFVQTKKMLLVK
jgi:hypothetical protein